MTASKSQFIVIVGCGKLGSYIAGILSRDGHSVVVIDAKKSAFDALSPEFSGFQIEGDATELGVLREAKAEKADILIASTDNDNVNLMVAQIAKEFFNIRKVIARIYEIKREMLCKNRGIETVCPSSVVGDIFLNFLSDSLKRN